jgi:hypothetical protein
MSSLNVLPSLKAQDYTRSPLHGADCAWPEKNCYVDLFIELVHSLGLEPRAMLPFTLAMDFMGDQWTFFKPQHSEMRTLYGIEVQEMNCWRPLIEHAREHLAAGRLIAVEANAHWMPDTVGTDYRRQHVKTTIMLTELDEAAGRLAYFHNAGFYELSGEDFRQTFRLDAAPDPTHLPLFAELVRVDRVVHRSPAELAALARPLLSQYLGWVPATNPIHRFAQRFEQELPRMHELGLPYYHAWAFSTVRQLGAAFELAAAHLNWLSSADGSLTDARRALLTESAQAFDSISQVNKTLILKLARAVNAKRLVKGEETFGPMAQSWQQGMDALREALG